MIPYGKPSLLPCDIERVNAVLKTPILTRGDTVLAFERSLEDFCGVQFAVAFNSGSSALHAACFAANLSTLDRVISTPNTFIATVSAALQRGAKLELVDIDRNTGNLNETDTIKQINAPLSRGRPILIPVHFSGIACDMQRIDKGISNPNTLVIEDAAHALGSLYPSGEKVGSCTYSAMTIFSFHPVKTITTGEGGMVTTNDRELYQKLLLFRNNGIFQDPLKREEMPWHYDVVALSGNTHLTELGASLGLSQMERLESLIQKRRNLVTLYQTYLKDIPHIRLFTSQVNERTCYHLFVIQIDFHALEITKNQLMKALKEKGIGTQVHYIPLYHHTALKPLSSPLPEMESYYEQALSLPLHTDLCESDIAYICETLRACTER